MASTEKVKGHERRGDALRVLFQDEPLRRECCWCVPKHIVAPGRLPATSGACPEGLKKLAE